MVIRGLRQRAVRGALFLSVALLFGAACDKEKSEPVEAKQIFTEPKAASVAEAAADGDAAEVDELIKAGADANARGERGVNLLQWALMHKSKKGLEALLKAGADPARADDTGETVVHYAAKANDPEYLDILLANRADPNTPNAVTRATPLMSALLGEREAQFRKLLSSGADVKLADRLGNTALHLAAKINDTQRVLDLLEAGADPTARNKQGLTFQRYLNTTPPETLTDKARSQRETIHKWLRDRNMTVEEAPAR